MERSAMIEIAQKVMGYYGPLKPWSDERLLSHVAAQFAGYLPDKVKAAVDQWATEHPDRAPKPAELLAYMRKDQAPTSLTDPDRCGHPQPWALVDERTEHDSEAQPPIPPLTLAHPIGTRIAMCLRCRTEFVRKPGTFLTETETETRRQARQETH